MSAGCSPISTIGITICGFGVDQARQAGEATRNPILTSGAEHQ